MAGSALRPVARELRDFYGRRYRVGESDRDLVGRSRRWMLWAAWAAMFAASVGQYGYAALLPVVRDAHGWSAAQGFWVLAVWTVFQGATVYPAATLRLRPVAALSAGAVLCASGLVALGGSGSFPVVLVSHAVLGGIGAGLIYGTSLSVVAKWYPERSGRTAFASGAFGYGVLPFLVVAGLSGGRGELGALFGFAGLGVLAVVGGAALVLREPPVDWWPSHVDPRVWALDKRVNPGLRNNRPAIRRYSPAELVRCPEFRLLFPTVAAAAAVALFDLAYLAVFAAESGGFAVAAVGVLAAASGGARTAAGWAADRLGRGRVLRGVLVAGGAAQVVLLFAGDHRLPGLLLVGACLAGAAAGACYALLPGLVEGHFGDRPGLPNFGACYAAKAIGGLAGVGMAGFSVAWQGKSAAFAVAAALSLVAAILVTHLRQPGRPHLPLPGVVSGQGG
ncbi:MFS transporter [Amycolatopsis anabasis]|uniref:MFS transporter n=1 Tax=Amycolatopsis anabasis TaxID=1840409 RepID=UPI00131BCF83|nr:MFS transporter [Amycolatopsis anabasis]